LSVERAKPLAEPGSAKTQAYERSKLYVRAEHTAVFHWYDRFVAARWRRRFLEDVPNRGALRVKVSDRGRAVLVGIDHVRLFN